MQEKEFSILDKFLSLLLSLLDKIISSCRD